jgi:ABC-2 type transport system ATP-binding protein
MASVVVSSLTATTLPIEVEAFVKHFGGVAAVDGVSLMLRPGECLGLLGPNGAGKSTLIRGIAGRVLPDAGNIRIFGEAAGSPRARQALGWVPQDLAIYPRLTCRENLISFGKYPGVGRNELASQIDWCLGWAALQDRAHEPTRNLSGGMKRRLNMAAGVIHRPRVVLMDEPTVGVDPQSRNRIFEMIEALRAQGSSILYTTHYMEEAEHHCDRIAIIDHGKIIIEGSHDDLVRNVFGTSSQVLARFVGPIEEITAWVDSRGGRVGNGAAQFTVQHPTEIASLLDDAAAHRFEVADVSLRRPNLESVFLHLTGRGLRD